MRLVSVKRAVWWKAETVRTKISSYKDEKNPTPRMGFCERFLHMCGAWECFYDFIVLFRETINGTVNQKIMLTVPSKIQFNIRMISQHTSGCHFIYNNNNNIYLPGGIGYFTCIQNMKLITAKFKSEGLYEKHVVATWNLGNHLSICFLAQGNQEKPVSRWPVAGPSEFWLLASSPASTVKNSNSHIVQELHIR
jgi:hypothetical protein